jgi:hypothetical protein
VVVGQDHAWMGWDAIRDVHACFAAAVVVQPEKGGGGGLSWWSTVVGGRRVKKMNMTHAPGVVIVVASTKLPTLDEKVNKQRKAWLICLVCSA